MKLPAASDCASSPDIVEQSPNLRTKDFFNRCEERTRLDLCYFRNGARYIINVTSNLPNTFEDNPSFHYLRISVDDNSSHNLSQHFPEAIAFIDAAARAGDACLVHCLAGISRSVTVSDPHSRTSSYTHSLEDAYDLVLRRNASIAPNFHFMGQLTEYERHLGLRGSSMGVSLFDLVSKPSLMPPSHPLGS
ncbi:unnamed protein product [Heligmosomoides polygyrus]|uniref:protein-tyrosine-phosphatase n=1 Tax=Heligmosomoides polygyrus TaxID=6339 RepID=A0A3P7UX65_HELPZ|nr:unnamed protein product [Heligmosomoides polygyrus]